MCGKRRAAPPTCGKSPSTRIAQHVLRGRQPLGRVDAAARMRGAAREEEAADRRARAPHPGVWAEEQLMVQLVAAAAQVAADHRRVVLLHLLRAPQLAIEYARAEPRCEALDLRLDQVSRLLRGDAQRQRRARVAVERVLAGRRTGVVEQRVLADHERRALGELARTSGAERADEVAEPVPDVDDGGTAAALGQPWHRLVEREVDLEGPAVVVPAA